MRQALSAVAVLSIAGIVTFVGCTPVNDELGLDLVPDKDRLSIQIDTLYGVETYNTQTDSLRSGSLGYGFLGQTLNDTFGMRRASFITQFACTGLPYAGGYGLDAIFDSIQLNLSIVDYAGDTTANQKFYVYEAANSFINSTTIYYTSFYPTPYIGSTPLSSFGFKTTSSTALTLPTYT